VPPRDAFPQIRWIWARLHPIQKGVDRLMSVCTLVAVADHVHDHDTRFITSRLAESGADGRARARARARRFDCVVVARPPPEARSARGESKGSTPNTPVFSRTDSGAD
jgi:hypothetical protein